MFDGSLTMSFHTLNCPSTLVGGIKKHKIQFRTRSFNPNFLVKPLSILLQTDEHGNSESLGPSKASSAPVLSQPNTVGIIGGVSAVSTLSFLGKLVEWSSKNGEESLPFVVCSDPVLIRDLSSRERGSFLYTNSRNSGFQSDHTRGSFLYTNSRNSGFQSDHTRGSFLYTNSRNSGFQSDHTHIVDNLRGKRNFLVQSGACCIVMPCHISHSWHGEIAEDCSVTFLHVGECVAKELKEANLKPIEAGSSLRIGVLATEATLAAGFYQEKLQNQGFEVVLPDKATMEHTVIPAIEALTKKDMEGARNLLRIALQVLLVRAVNTIIIASDDMRGLLPRDDPLLKKCIDPMDALVRSTIKWAQSTEKGVKE